MAWVQAEGLEQTGQPLPELGEEQGEGSAPGCPGLDSVVEQDPREGQAEVGEEAGLAGREAP